MGQRNIVAGGPNAKFAKDTIKGELTITNASSTAKGKYDIEVGKESHSGEDLSASGHRDWAVNCKAAVVKNKGETTLSLSW
jgi:hypothetical protein